MVEPGADSGYPQGMGLRRTLAGMKSEWVGFARSEEAGWRRAQRWILQWGPFGVRTVGYGTVSLVLGPLTADHRASTWAMKRWSCASLAGLAIEAELRGKRHVPAGGLMYAANHQSLLDILVLGAVLPGDIKWAAKRSLLQIPFLGWHLALSGHVPVDRRGGKRAVAHTVARFERVMRSGKPLLIFPEGTRSEDDRIRAFKTGGFYAAVRADRPVVPVALDGTYRLMGKHATDTGDVASGAQKRRVVVAIGAPLVATTRGSEQQRARDLRDRTRAAVVALHQQIVSDGT